MTKILLIGSFMNMGLTLFNLIGMETGLRGSFIDWYLENGFWILLGSLWGLAILIGVLT